MTVRLNAFSRFVLVAGLAAWLTIAAFNNLTDPQTNRHLLGQTLSMALVATDPILGTGLTWRAWPAEWATNLLYFIVAIQFLIALLLWAAALGYLRAIVRNTHESLRAARTRATLALTAFLMLWFWFLCGGLWFGYWLKQGAIQSVHMTLVIISLLALNYVQAGATNLSAGINESLDN